MKLNDVTVKPKKKKESPLARKNRERREHKFSDSVGGNKSNYVREDSIEGEFLPNQSGAAEQIAKEILTSTNGNSETAKKMARLFLKNLMRAIDDQSNIGSMQDANAPRTRRAEKKHTGYDQSRPSSFSQVA